MNIHFKLFRRKSLLLLCVFFPGCPSCLLPIKCPFCCSAFWVSLCWHLASHSLDYISEGTQQSLIKWQMHLKVATTLDWFLWLLRCNLICVLVSDHKVSVGLCCTYSAEGAWPSNWSSQESGTMKRNMVVADDAAFREKSKLLTSMERQKWLNTYMQKLLVVNSSWCRGETAAK